MAASMHTVAFILHDAADAAVIYKALKAAFVLETRSRSKAVVFAPKSLDVPDEMRHLLGKFMRVEPFNLALQIKHYRCTRAVFADACISDETIAATARAAGARASRLGDVADVAVASWPRAADDADNPFAAIVEGAACAIAVVDPRVTKVHIDAALSAAGAEMENSLVLLANGAAAAADDGGLGCAHATLPFGIYGEYVALITDAVDVVLAVDETCALAAECAAVDRGKVRFVAGSKGCAAVLCSEQELVAALLGEKEEEEEREMGADEEEADAADVSSSSTCISSICGRDENSIHEKYPDKKYKSNQLAPGSESASGLAGGEEQIDFSDCIAQPLTLSIEYGIDEALDRRIRSLARGRVVLDMSGGETECADSAVRAGARQVFLSKRCPPEYTRPPIDGVRVIDLHSDEYVSGVGKRVNLVVARGLCEETVRVIRLAAADPHCLLTAPREGTDARVAASLGYRVVRERFSDPERCGLVHDDHYWLLVPAWVYLQPGPQMRVASMRAGRVRARTFDVQLLGNFGDCDRDILDQWRRMSADGRGGWNRLRVTAAAAREGDPSSVPSPDPDYFVVINRPREHAYAHPLARTVVFGMEPYMRSVPQVWFSWIADERELALAVRHEAYKNNGEWWLARSFGDLAAASSRGSGKDAAAAAEVLARKTRGNAVSTVMSAKQEMPGHVFRVALARALDDLAAGDGGGDDEPLEFDFDVFGTCGALGLRAHVGELPPTDKTAGLEPYKYTIAVENSSIDNYFTEKFIDALLCETLVFYWGCPNLEEYVNPAAFVRLPADMDVGRGVDVVRAAVRRGAWEKRIGAIRHEKARVLHFHTFFPYLEGLLFLHELPVAVINLARRPDRMASAHAQLARYGLRYTRVDATDAGGVPPRWREFLFAKTDKAFTEGEVACAYSHLRVWEQLAARLCDDELALVLEDDVVLCSNFGTKLAFVLEFVSHMANVPDLIYAGFIRRDPGVNRSDPWWAEPVARLADEVFTPHDTYNAFGNHGGGAHAYLLSGLGARKMLAFVAANRFVLPVDYIMNVGVVNARIDGWFTREVLAETSGSPSDVQPTERNSRDEMKLVR